MAAPGGSDKKPGLDPRLQAKFLERLEDESRRLTRARRIRDFLVSPVLVAAFIYFGTQAYELDGMARIGRGLLAFVMVLALAWAQRERIRELLGMS